MLVSVVMSIYEPDLDYLAVQLDSIDAQDVDDMEIVIYNDCPESENLEEFCRSHCTSHQLRYLHGKENLGFVKAFELLTREAKGTYIAFSDQDDCWLEGRLSKCLPYFEQGYLLVTCDRQIIDSQGHVLIESWRKAHPKDLENSWQTGDHLLPQAVFTCFSIGMATMICAQTARELMPYPTCTGHDKWLAMGASALGSCAFVDEPLVQYRRHDSNVSGVMSRIASKSDWRERRTVPSFELATTFCERFPDLSENQDILAFAQARLDGNVLGMLRGARIAPLVACFEIALRIVPEPILKRALHW